VIDAAWTAVAGALGVEPGTRILDVGCGDGGFLEVVAALGAQASGLDADPMAVARARQRLPGVDARTGFMESLPWADASFDRVVGINAFQYAFDIDLALVEALRVLRRDGRLGVCAWAQDNDLFRLAVAIGAGRPGALRVQDPVDEAIRCVGLRVTERGEVPVCLEVPDVAALARVVGVDDPAALAEHAHRYRTPHGSYRFAAGITWLIAAE
jgi:ubiquinone/menaquinone biosynthesis C-methylase UbiE